MKRLAMARSRRLSRWNAGALRSSASSFGSGMPRSVSLDSCNLRPVPFQTHTRLATANTSGFSPGGSWTEGAEAAAAH